MESPIAAHAAPRVDVVVDSVEPEGVAGQWRVAWLVRNREEHSLWLESAWIPHGRFRGEGRLSLDLDLEADGSRRLEFRVAAQEAPGTLVENAFFIVRARLQATSWRIFTRMRIEFDERAVPRPVVELVSMATIGT